MRIINGAGDNHVAIARAAGQRHAALQKNVTSQQNIAVGGAMAASELNGICRDILHAGGGDITSKGCHGCTVHRQTRQRIGCAHVRLQINAAGVGSQIQRPGVARVTVDGADDGNVANARASIDCCISSQNNRAIEVDVICRSGDIRTQVNACRTGHRNNTARGYRSVDIHLASAGNQRGGASGIAAGNNQITGGFSNGQIADRTGTGNRIRGVAGTVTNQIDDTAVAAGDIHRGGIDIQAAVEITDGVGRGQRQRADVVQAGTGILVINREAKQYQVGAAKIGGLSTNSAATVIQFELCADSCQHADIRVVEVDLTANATRRQTKTQIAGLGKHQIKGANGRQITCRHIKLEIRCSQCQVACTADGGSSGQSQQTGARSICVSVQINVAGIGGHGAGDCEAIISRNIDVSRAADNQIADAESCGVDDNNVVEGGARQAGEIDGIKIITGIGQVDGDGIHIGNDAGCTGHDHRTSLIQRAATQDFGIQRTIGAATERQGRAYDCIQYIGITGDGDQVRVKYGGGGEAAAVNTGKIQNRKLAANPTEAQGNSIGVCSHRGGASDSQIAGTRDIAGSRTVQRGVTTTREDQGAARRCAQGISAATNSQG